MGNAYKFSDKLKNIGQFIFSIKNDDIYKVVTFLGIKIRIESNRLKQRKNNEEILVLEKQLESSCTYLLDKLMESNNNSSSSYFDFIDKLFNKEKLGLAYWHPNYNNVIRFYRTLFKQKSDFIDSFSVPSDCNRLIFWGTRFNLFTRSNTYILKEIFSKHKKYAIAEMGFIHRIAFPSPIPKFSQSCSFVFDDIAPYYDARFPNRLEQLLNDKNLVITEEQKRRARKCIDKILETHLTKYNHQPIYEPKIGRDGVKKILVVDQVYGDMSISKGLASDETFKDMLDCAIKENPEADIIVKIHPDTIDGAGGYYKDLKPHDNIYLMPEPINPISLAKYCDKVYVCTTQLGFEALICGKEVHVFGMPFYAGWGITNDRQILERRTNKRTLEEVFYIAYIIYSHYVNPETESRCEIEDTMDYLLKLRDEFNKNKYLYEKK